MFAEGYIGLFLVLLVSVFGPASAQEDYCYSRDREQPQNLRFASKTAYEFIKATANDFDHQIPHCTAIQFWFIARHGTRLPGKDEINTLPKLINIRNEIIVNYEDRRTAPDHGRLCNADLDNLKGWTWNNNITVNYANYLAPQGYDDMKFLAKRYQSKYPDLLTPPYSQSSFHFRYTDTERAQRSAEAFAEGLFAPNPVNLPPAFPNDTLLRPYDFCPRWQNQTYKEERDKFIKSKIYKKMLTDVSTRLGFKYTLDESDIEAMWDMCRYDKAWEVTEISPWCAVFTIDQVKILEYKEDLKYFYKTSYGNKFNKEVGCEALKDMLDLFNNTVHGNLGPRATTYFTHSATMVLLKTALGISEDTHRLPKALRADNYARNANRKFRISNFDPFASNLAAILYKCDSSQPAEYQILFYENEGPVELTDCRLGLCTWNTVLRKYGALADECNKDACFRSSAVVITSSLLTIISVMLWVI